MSKGLYIHVPFCKSKCHYCDFYRVKDLSFINGYLSALEKEIKSVCGNSDNKISTIYIGGGTPSALELENIEKLIDIIYENFDTSNVEEFTFECNPEDVNEDLVSLLIDKKVDRISLGVQSLDDKILRFMNRRHSSAKVYKTLELLKNKGISKLSVDFIYGLPNNLDYNFEEDLKKFLELEVSHISAYSLTYEKSSMFSKMLEIGKIVKKDDDVVFEEYSTLISKMKEYGYDHYEISNFSKDEKSFSKHNISYWNRVPYFGIGPGACSFDGKVRRNNVCDVEKYIINTLTGNEISEVEILSEDEIYNEIVMLGLRTKFGVDVKQIENLGKKYSTHFTEKIQPFINDRSIIVNDGIYKLDEKKWFVSDMITSSLFF